MRNVAMGLVMLGLARASAWAQTAEPTPPKCDGPWGRGAPRLDGVEIHSAKPNCPCCCRMSSSPSHGIWAPPKSWLDDSSSTQEEPPERPEIVPLNSTSGLHAGFLPKLEPGFDASWSLLTADTHDVATFEFPIELDGVPSGQIEVDELDVTRLDGWRIGGQYWHVSAYVQMRDGTADETPFSIENPLDPRETFSGNISWDLSSLEIGIAVPVAFVAYADTVQVTLAIGGGWYRMTVEPSGPTDFEFTEPPQPPPAPPPRRIAGRITYDDETMSGLFATIGTHARVRLWRGLHADARAELFNRMGDARATYVHLTLGASWSF